MSASKELERALGQIHHGDCIAGMNAIPAGSVDLVFADPPFNIGYDYDVYHDSQEYDQYLAWSREWIGAVRRILKPDGTFWLAIGDEYAAELKIESQKLGFHIRSWVIWYYTFGVNCKTKFSRSHAHLFHFAKDAKRFTFRAEELENRIPSARLLVYGDSRGNPNGRLPDDTWIIRPEDASAQFSPDDTWILRPQDLAGHFAADEENWYFPRVAGTFKERAGFHGCQMPEQLLGRIIRICSHENEIVLDPFSGSATTLVVAKKLRRRFVGFELSPDYVKRGTERLNGIRIGDALTGSVEPTMSAPQTTGTKGIVRRAKRGSSQSPLETVLRNSALAQVEWSSKAFVDGIIEAFVRVRDGYSADRVVADPELNQSFAEHCTRVGIAGDIRAWNHTLFQLRKDGKLANLPTTRRTEISWEQCDAFLFASEIAWKQMLDEGYASLDEILCDPAAAAEFDSRARKYAPECKSIEYRLGALKLRKAAKNARTQSKTLKFGRLESPIAVSANNWSKFPKSAGAYLVADANDERPLYAGESLNLRSRFKYQFSTDTRKSMKSWGRRLSLRFFTAEPDTTLLLAYQSLFVRKFSPQHNLPDLALA